MAVEVAVGGGQSRTAVTLHCVRDLCVPELWICSHRSLFTALRIKKKNKSNCHCHPKMLSWTAQGRAVISLAFKKFGLSLVRLEFEEAV